MLTDTHVARSAGITAQISSFHLAGLNETGLLAWQRRQRRLAKRAGQMAAMPKTYPEAMRRAQGLVLIRFTVDHTGRVSDVMPKSSPDSPILFAAAQVILRGTVLSALPDSLPQNELIARIAISFSLLP